MGSVRSGDIYPSNSNGSKHLLQDPVSPWGKSMILLNECSIVICVKCNLELVNNKLGDIEGIIL